MEPHRNGKLNKFDIEFPDSHGKKIEKSNCKSLNCRLNSPCDSTSFQQETGQIGINTTKNVINSEKFNNPINHGLHLPSIIMEEPENRSSSKSSNSLSSTHNSKSSANLDNFDDEERVCRTRSHTFDAPPSCKIKVREELLLQDQDDQR